MSRSTINTKWWSNGDNETVIHLKKKSDGQPIGDLTGATITARLMDRDNQEIVAEVPQPDTNDGADWTTATIGILFSNTDSDWTTTGLGHYLQLKVVHGGKTKFYETAAFIELELGF